MAQRKRTTEIRKKRILKLKNKKKASLKRIKSKNVVQPRAEKTKLNRSLNSVKKGKLLKTKKNKRCIQSTK